MATIPYGYWFVAGVVSLLALVTLYWYANFYHKNETFKS